MQKRKPLFFVQRTLSSNDPEEIVSMSTSEQQQFELESPDVLTTAEGSAAPPIPDERNIFKNLTHWCGLILNVLSWIFVFSTFPISIWFCIKFVQEYERAVVFRFGRIVRGARGPGLFVINPCTDEFVKVDLRLITFDVPPQEILSKDSVTVTVDAVLYFRIYNTVASVIAVEDVYYSTKLLCQTMLRNTLGTKTLSEMLSDREAISKHLRIYLDKATDPWGVKVERIEIKDIRLPVELQRSMAAEAEAAREAKAKVIAAEGEHRASNALRTAAENIAGSTNAVQLRYFQTLGTIAAEKNSTIIFPLPIDLIARIKDALVR